jgi:hypothetical protein
MVLLILMLFSTHLSGSNLISGVQLFQQPTVWHNMASNLIFWTYPGIHCQNPILIKYNNLKM